MHNLIVDIVTGGGYWGILFLMALENVFPPIPSELIMGLGGIAIARGEMTFVPLLVAGTIGSVIGNCAWFWLGRAFGYQRLRPLIERRGRWLAMNWSDVERATTFFRRHGQWVVFVGRFLPFVRTLISLPAGISGMSLWRFLVFTAAGAAVWNTALILAGSYAGDAFASAEEWLGWITIGLFALGIAGYLKRVIFWKKS